MKLCSKYIALIVLLTTLGLTTNLSLAHNLPPLQSQPTTAPNIEAIYDLGVPAGNAAGPRHLALDSAAGQVYIFSDGLPILKEGNGLSVYDIQSGEITEHVKVNQGDNETLDLQFDPETGLIFALWREKFSDTLPAVTVLDRQSLEIVEELAGVEAIAVGAGLLYTAAGDQLTRWETSGAGLTETGTVDLPTATAGPLALDSANNRLYAARSSNGAWTLETFSADALDLRTSYVAEGPILNLFPISTTGEVLVIVALGDFRTMYRLSADGEPVDTPLDLGPRYGAAGIALTSDEQALYFSNGQPPTSDPNPTGLAPGLAGVAISTGLPLDDIPLLSNVDDLVIDPDTATAFGLYPFDSLLYAIDLANESFEITATAVALRDVLVDEEEDRLFVSDSANRIRQLDLDSLEVLAETTLTGNLEDYGFKLNQDSGQLTLDPTRQRLYVSGYPATVLDSDTLAEVATLEAGGQIAVDPTGDAVYLSNCGVTVLDANTLEGDAMLPESGPRLDQMAPNPCVAHSQLDVTNQLLYSIVPNGVPGSNGGSYLYVYDLEPAPTLVFTDTEISIVSAEPDSTNGRAFVTYLRNSNRRLRTLDMTAAAPRYTHQLLGVFGNTGYNPATNLLHFSDHNHHRLLTLEADTLDVVGETLLPANRDYRLAAVDSLNNRLYLIGLGGQLLVASAEAEPDARIQALVEESVTPDEPRLPDGSVIELEATAQSTVATILSSYDEFSTEARLYLSTDEGESWTDLSLNLPPLPERAFALSPTFDADQTLFAALLAPGQTGGLYKSTDGGQSWVPAMRGLQDLWVDDLFISPNFEQDGLIFAQTTYAGLHQSGDGGQTWTPLTELDPNALFPTANRANSVAFSQNGKLLASRTSGDAGGIYLAEVTQEETLSDWEQVFDIPVNLLALSPDGNVALAFANGLWRSGDGGLTWEAGGAGLSGIENMQPQKIIFSPNFLEDETAYFFLADASGSQSGTLFRSTDGGQRWQPWQKPVAGGNFTTFTLTPEGDFLLGNDQGELIRLAPSAVLWAGAELPAAPFPLDDLVASPNYSRDQTIFAVSGRHGLYKSGDGGQSWQLTGFSVRGSSQSKYGLAISPNFGQDETLYATTGRSLHRSTDTGESWEQLNLAAGDASTQQFIFRAQQIALSPTFAQDETVLVSTPQGVYQSSDGGDHWRQVFSHPGDAGTSDILALGPDGQTVYARFGYSQPLLVSSDGAQTWQEQSGPDQYFFIVAGSVASDGTLTAALEFDTRLLQTTPQAQVWDMLDGPAELSNVTAVAYTPDNALYIGGQGGLFFSLDEGQSWQSTASNLPPELNILDLYATDSHLFAASADGLIYVSSDGEANWQEISIVK